MSFNSLDEILKTIIKWEEDFDYFYDMMEDYLKNEKSRELAYALQKRHEKVLEVLESIKVQDYKNVEFVKYVPEYHGEDTFEMSADASIEEVFGKILDHEEKRVQYYRQLRDVVVFEKSKGLFDMLIQLKMSQVKQIKELMDSHELAI